MICSFSFFGQLFPPSSIHTKNNHFKNLSFHEMPTYINHFMIFMWKWDQIKGRGSHLTEPFTTFSSPLFSLPFSPTLLCIFSLLWNDLASTSYRHCCCLVSKSCLTLFNPLDCNPPGSSVHGIFQARTLETVAISSSRGSSQSRGWTCLLHWQVDSLPWSHQGRPVID